MKVFAATLLATAALGVHLQASSNKYGLNSTLEKDVLAATNRLIKDVDKDGDGHLYSKEITQALLANKADPAMANGLARGFSEETEGDGISADDLRDVMLK